MKKYITRFLVLGICSVESPTKGSEGFVYLQIEGQKMSGLKAHFLIIFFHDYKYIMFISEKKMLPSSVEINSFLHDRWTWNPTN